MLFVEIGREVAMRELENREHKAVVTGIIDNKFIVILKKDKQSEVIRVDDIVLCDKVYDLNNLESEGFFKVEEKKVETDFDRYKQTLRQRITEKLLEETGL